jgi:hypothetical protein
LVEIRAQPVFDGTVGICTDRTERRERLAQEVSVRRKAVGPLSIRIQFPSITILNLRVRSVWGQPIDSAMTKQLDSDATTDRPDVFEYYIE